MLDMIDLIKSLNLLLKKNSRVERSCFLLLPLQQLSVRGQ